MDSLRQALLMFGGSLRTESHVDWFPDVSLVVSGDPSRPLVKGVFHFTTKRILFLPSRSSFQSMVQAGYDSLRCLSGTRTDLSISLVDANGATAKFQFTSPPALFRAFNLLRGLAEASRGSEREYSEFLSRLGGSAARDETPFSTIEIELGEGTDRTAAILAPAAAPAAASEEDDGLAHLLEPLREFYQRCGRIHLDIHAKLWAIFVLSLVSSCLRIMPFLPFCAACMFAFLMFTAWRSMNQDLDEVGEGCADVPAVVEGFVKVQAFAGDWLFWGKPRKGMALCQWSLGVLIAWAVLPRRLYVIAGAVVTGAMALTLLEGDSLSKLYSGPWVCT
jgi:hypothetical protein